MKLYIDVEKTKFKKIINCSADYIMRYGNSNVKYGMFNDILRVSDMMSAAASIIGELVNLEKFNKEENNLTNKFKIKKCETAIKFRYKSFDINYSEFVNKLDVLYKHVDYTENVNEKDAEIKFNDFMKDLGLDIIESDDNDEEVKDYIQL